MINDPNMINKLLTDFNKIPEEIIKDAIKEVIEEDKREKTTLKTALQIALQTVDIERYDVEKNCYRFAKINEYVHKNNRTNSNWINTLLKRDKEKEEVEVA